MAARGGAVLGSNKICQFKLVLLGESAVGKSSLVLRFVKGQFQEFQESTIGGMDHSSDLYSDYAAFSNKLTSPVSPYKCA